MIDKSDLITTIGLEIHVQLKTKSKMFCSCDNNAEGKKPNTLVCPVCLGLPGALPVANKQAVLWTIKAGLALDCKINKIAKFDRKHYFYPDLPKGYQISQYDEPFCIGGMVEINGHEVRLNRIHLEEDAGKLIHVGGKSLVDLNRAGTPLMEIVTEPDITSPGEAGEFLRKLQKIVKDVAQVSEANMEKGHLRCDANISVNDGERMSPIVELKNLNSFRFVEKALSLVEEKLKSEHSDWPEKKSKETWGYDSVNNKVYLQRRKEEAADYRYFPEPDLPPFDTTEIDLEELRLGLGEDENSRISKLLASGIAEPDAKTLVSGPQRMIVYQSILSHLAEEYAPDIAKMIVHNYFGVLPSVDKSAEYAKAVVAFRDGKIMKAVLPEIARGIEENDMSFERAMDEFGGVQEGGEDDIQLAVDKVVNDSPAEVDAYKAGKVQLFGFFMGQLMKATKGKADPKVATALLKKKLDE